MVRTRALAGFIAFLLLVGCGQTPAPSEQIGPIGGDFGSRDLVSYTGDREFFALDRAVLDKDGLATLKRQAYWLGKFPNVKVLIAGNADERGTETYNLALGQRRAEVARDALVLDGLAPSRITTISYGKDCPVASGNDEASYQQNRNAITSEVGYNPQSCR